MRVMRRGRLLRLPEVAAVKLRWSLGALVSMRPKQERHGREWANVKNNN